MREIKFRAWNDVTKKGEMVKDFTLGENTVNNGFKDAKIKIMQFTGLKDKNSVDIYEGDIVKWGHIDGYSSECWHRIAKVELFPALQFRILFYIDSNTKEEKPTDNHIFEFGRFAYKDTHKYIEVIGNIYENPELVQDVK